MGVMSLSTFFRGKRKCEYCNQNEHMCLNSIHAGDPSAGA
jgi:hypothetical protein